MKGNKDGVIVRKQVLVDKTYRNMFLWVIGSSAIVGASIVLMIMLVQILFFNEKVLIERGRAVKQVAANIDAAAELRAEIEVRNTDENLKLVQTSDKAQPLQAVLDALPADANELALGASLQKRLLGEVGPDVTVDNVSLTGLGDTESESESNDGLMKQQFTATITGTPEGLRSALERLERSIRAVDITSLSASSGSASRVTLNITGSVSYLPPMKVEKTQKKIKG